MLEPWENFLPNGVNRLLSPPSVLYHRSLWSMRSYIHIMLCGSMFAAQLTFAVGVGMTNNEVEFQ